ncbi:MAG: hypothetical protein ACUVWP_06260 [bacterium]
MPICLIIIRDMYMVFFINCNRRIPANFPLTVNNFNIPLRAIKPCML